MERANISYSVIGMVAVLSVVILGCGSSAESVDSADAAATTVASNTEQSESTTTPQASEGTDESTAPVSNDKAAPTIFAADVDWATVDLSSFDWFALDDIGAVDNVAIEGNPTYDQIDYDAIAQAFPETAGGGGSSDGEDGGSGEATLTVAGTTYQFDGFICAFGHGASESETFSFTSNAFGEVDGVRVQFQVDVSDPDDEGRTSGAGVDPGFTLDDIDDFENPSVSFESAGDMFTLTIDGDHLTGEGTATDYVTSTYDIPFSLDATCGPGSRR